MEPRLHLSPPSERYGKLVQVTVLAITRQTGIRLAELGLLLMAIAGALVLLSAVVPYGRRAGAGLGGLALAAGGVLLIVAVHWGHFR
jgi:hypothetical protein